MQNSSVHPCRRQNPVCDTAICQHGRVGNPHTFGMSHTKKCMEGEQYPPSLVKMSREAVRNTHTHRVFCVSIFQHEVFLVFCSQQVLIQTEENIKWTAYGIHFIASLNIFELNNIVLTAFPGLNYNCSHLQCVLIRIR